jgi:hypothetical protein
MAQMRVFVSHSHEDDTFCRALVDGLRLAGADVWYDEHNLGSGQLIDKIEVELRDRPVFVVVLSPAALRSQWVRDEVKWAFQRLRRDPSRIILPVLAGAVEEDAIWLFLQDFKRIEAPGVKPLPQAEAVARTLHALQLTRPGEAPLPTAPQPAESADDLVTRGRALNAQQRYAEALPLFQRAAQLDPNFAPAWHNKGVTLENLKRYAEALAAYDKAAALDLTFALPWLGRRPSCARWGGPPRRRRRSGGPRRWAGEAPLWGQVRKRWCDNSAQLRLPRHSALPCGLTRSPPAPGAAACPPRCAATAPPGGSIAAA